jgi:hypothetical protein
MDDAFKIAIRPDDTVVVCAYGYGARVTDCGTRSRVVRFNRSRVVIIDSDGCERAVDAACLAIARRDGGLGLEGNATP